MIEVWALRLRILSGCMPCCVKNPLRNLRPNCTQLFSLPRTLHDHNIQFELSVVRVRKANIESRNCYKGNN